YTFTTPGTYFVGVTGYDNHNYDPHVSPSGVAGRTGTYGLSLSLTPGGAAAPDDAGDTLDDALDTDGGPGIFAYSAINQAIGDGLFPNLDVDLYRFQARAGAQLDAVTGYPQGGYDGGGPI